jgi:hypothetical protein
MGNYAIIKNNQIANAIVAEPEVIASGVIGGLCIELPDGFGIGDTWDGEKFVKQIVEEVVND